MKEFGLVTTPHPNLPVAGSRSNGSNAQISGPSWPPSATRSKRWGSGLFYSLARGYLSSSISADFAIEGNVSCNGHARLDGAVYGNVTCKDLVVGANGNIVGDITAETIVVYGTVSGSVYCRKAKLKSGARVEGDIYHEELAIESGAHFAGKSVRQPASESHEAENDAVTMIEQ